MSQLDDLIDLIRTTNEVYFITAPNRVRTVYILVDDITELALKAYLLQQTLDYRQLCQTDLETKGWVQNSNHRVALTNYFDNSANFNELKQALGINGPDVPTFRTDLNAFDQTRLQHWSINNPEAKKDFPTVTGEVRDFHPAGHPVLDILDEMSERHRKRNKFFHDHHQTGLTIPDKECLRALCDLFLLMEQLFPQFPDRVKSNYSTVGCQIGILRLRLAASETNELLEPYNRALEQFNRTHQISFRSVNFEHSVLHTISDQFFAALREQFTEEIASLELRNTAIDGMRRQQAKHRVEKRVNEDRISILQQQLDEIKALTL